MKKIVLVLALSGLIGAAATPAMACEGGKCTKENCTDAGKAKKEKKSAKTTLSKTADAHACCKKNATAKAEVTKTEKETKAQQ
ncbi:hypothetical protein [Pontibacter liquoris]|uniref:hypothetical protein n=1 Tax=Pontibacter liquoris TaxID=2905677 RepID=UPI001FA6F1AA|nr:hypothetical protein [Pontibacter liquoris]